MEIEILSQEKNEIEKLLAAHRKAWAWQAPSPEHETVRKLMLATCSAPLAGCAGQYVGDTPKVSPDELSKLAEDELANSAKNLRALRDKPAVAYWKDGLDAAKWVLNRLVENEKEDIARHKARAEWLTVLLESLPKENPVAVAPIA